MVERDLDHVGEHFHRAHSVTGQRVGRPVVLLARNRAFSCKFADDLLLPIIRFCWGFQMRTLTILVSLMCMALSVSAAKADRREIGRAHV